MMRAWGIGFMAAAAGATILGRVNVGLAYLLVSVVAIAFVVSLVGGWADRRYQQELDRAKETADHVGFFRTMKADLDDSEAEWAALVDATTPKPLGPKQPRVDPDRPRSVTRFPTQRTPGSAS